MGMFRGLRSNHGAVFHSRDLIPGVCFVVGRSEQFKVTFSSSSSFFFLFFMFQEKVKVS